MSMNILRQFTCYVGAIGQLPSLESVYRIVRPKNDVLDGELLATFKNGSFRNRFGFYAVFGVNCQMSGLFEARVFSSGELIFIVLIIFALRSFQSARRNLWTGLLDRKSTRLNSSHTDISRMPSSA